MTTKKPPKPIEGTHDKCLSITIRNGNTLICWKSPGHEKSADPTRREHYDPDADETWAG